MLTQIRQIQHHPTGVRHGAHKRTTIHCFAIELDVDVVGFRLFRRERHQTPTTTDNLHMIGHFALVDGNLQLPLAGGAGVDTELARLADNAAVHFRYLNEAGVVDFGNQRTADHFDAVEDGVDNVGAHLVGYELDAQRSVGRFVRHASGEFRFAGRLDGCLTGAARF